MDIEVKSCVQAGHDVYSTTCMDSYVRETLNLQRELDNSKDTYAVAICKDEDTVIGHIP